jgi:hypothetical protein
MRRVWIAATFVLCSVCLSSPARAENLWFGGGVGMSFGTVDWIEIAPIVGYNATDKLSFGGGVLYRYRQDGRFPGDPSTNDYGANVFVRYRITPWLFGHGEYEYLNYEFIRSDLSTYRDTFNSILAGPGISRPLGQRTAFYGLALYNFSYDDNDINSPYDDEWVIRIGVSVGF